MPNKSIRVLEDLKSSYSIIGNYDFFSESLHQSSMKSIKISTVLEIKKEKLIKVLKRFPEDYVIKIYIQVKLLSNKR